MTRARFFRFLAVLFVCALGYYIFTVRRASPEWATGVVDADQVVVNPEVTGRIVQLLVKEGDHVQKGQLLAVLDNSVYAAGFTAAQAGAAAAAARHRESRLAVRLAAGSLPQRVDAAQAQLAAAEANTEQAQANLRDAEGNYQRIEALAGAGVASQQELDDARMRRDSTRAAFAANQKLVAAARASVADAQAQLTQVSAQRDEASAMGAAAAQARAEAEQQRAQLAYTQVRAPIAGVIGVRAARQGEVVTPADAIVTIINLGDTWIQVDVDETEADRVRLGQRLQVRLPSGDTLQGQVSYKAAEADFATARDVSRTKRDIKAVQIRLAVPNPDEEMVPGMTAYARIPEMTSQ
jgi:multidrug resistance efflux pump